MTHAETRRLVNTVDRVKFRDMCARFTAAEIEPRCCAVDRNKQFTRDFYVVAAAAGLIGITAPDGVGGAGLGAYEEAIAMEAMAKVNPNLAVSVLVQNVELESAQASPGQAIKFDRPTLKRACQQGEQACQNLKQS